MIDRPTDILSAFVPVDIRSFRNTPRDITFDVYLRLSDDNIAHVFSRTTGLDYKRLAQYMQRGVRELYVRREDEESYRAFVARTAEAIFADPGTSQEKKIATLLNMTEQNMAELFAQLSVSDETANASQKVVKSYVSLMIEQPKTLAVILKLVSHGEYLYYHSIAVSIFSMFIAKASGQFNTRMLEIVGLGGFLHDVGCTQIPKEIVSSSTDLTEAQWQQMREHPKIGLTMLESAANVPDEARHIVYQHHEEPGGRGYPNKLHSPVIYYPAKIVALADAFSALISQRPWRAAYTVEQAIEVLREQPGKYDRELVQILSGVFLREAERSDTAAAPAPARFKKAA